MDVRIRPLVPDDSAAVGRIFFLAVHEGTRTAYTAAERLAWAGETIDLASWETRVAQLGGWVAELNGEPVGVMTIDATGYIDLAFVLPSCTGRGIGARLLRACAARAADLGATTLSAHASLVARPFFEAQGWHVEAEEIVERRGVPLRRFRMTGPLRMDR
ncbi:GNAT family N-acetyltransferase [Roseivivax marinus]|uniref:GNAT family N-acetyltransferase n=1 Tax=Roseivivax marinus TaxID=1379903 RepID=UPI001F04339E|nr:GNAT family N-acetyltransferase [Roseivivax marinus]UMA65084.1 GNAT family N-acetyltransferase [Roseivivax marinus]